MPTWENELYVNSFWLDTSNISLSVLKKYDPIQKKWVPTSGAYSTEETDTKIQELNLTISALEERLVALETT